MGMMPRDRLCKASTLCSVAAWELKLPEGDCVSSTALTSFSRSCSQDSPP